MMQGVGATRIQCVLYYLIPAVVKKKKKCIEKIFEDNMPNRNSDFEC